MAKVTALCSALSAKVSEDELIVLDKIELTAPKTKEIAAILKTLGADKRVLLVVTDANADVVRAARNLPSVTTVNSDLINVYDVVANEKLVATKDAVQAIEEVYKV
jgi:large subunit ribosomal protein L4